MTDDQTTTEAPDAPPPLLTEADAYRAARDRSRLQDTITKHHATRDAIVAEADEWLERVTKAPAAEIERLDGLLIAYHQEAMRTEPKTPKTLTFPGAVAKARAQQPVWTFDAATYLPWARTHAPTTVKSPPKPDDVVDVAAAKAVLQITGTGAGLVDTTTGAVIPAPGVTVETRPDKLTVDPA